jgi:hypothetical protein
MSNFEIFTDEYDEGRIMQALVISDAAGVYLLRMQTSKGTFFLAI